MPLHSVDCVVGIVVVGSDWYNTLTRTLSPTLTLPKATLLSSYVEGTSI